MLMIILLIFHKELFRYVHASIHALYNTLEACKTKLTIYVLYLSMKIIYVYLNYDFVSTL